ncbi:LysR family transcriptional regulator [Nostoc sp. 'Peltigera membranacea cyanobiont' 213]|uniref:LysR family transcriptional regulator n=1 Tax=Nostoc cyanobionts TaxID=3123326 RepID=UPI000B958656|nr:MULTISPECIES: LysR family transcriptional regulator [unclassified Nostoc]AVH66507.1 LysR family transcriptional regulator [Nostoc sp. 'Peltigera membranacea cyanobiont' N6]OYD88756.1 LysR family transcriptional regulator [Nostoc sp. 'Peltigera membranacea cyanobiont' 213]
MNKIKLEDITLNHIKILKAVDDCGSFSKAAQKLGCSQALISKKVKQIEDCFGVILLNRSPGSICLTNKGKKLISQTFNVVETVENLQEEFQTRFSAEGEDLILGATSLILEVWLKQYLQRFQLCFPGRNIKEIAVKDSRFFSNSQLLEIDLLLNSCAGYKEEHHCTRLTTHKMLLVSFGASKYLNEHSLVKINDIDLADIVLLDEVHQELSKNRCLRNKLSGVQVLQSYQDVLNYASENQKLTILPDFCQAEIISQYQVLILPIQDVNEYGIYLHVPRFSELLISAESLVRSFRLDRDNLESLPNINLILDSHSPKEENILRIGIQRDSIGQFIAGYGTKYISDLQRASSSLEQPIFKNIEINRNFELQILPFDSGEQMNRQMKRGELDICILDDISLLNNGSQFFDDLSFGSKLIGIASYNLLGQDINIVLHKDSSINTIQDLKGKRISTLFGSNAHRFIITLFDLYDMDVSKDCRLVNEDPRKASKSLANKTIDAYVGCHTFASILEAYAFVRKLPLSQTISLRIPSIRGIVCRSQFIKENPKIVVAYLHDLVVANYWFNSSPIKAGDLLTKMIDVRTTQVNQFFNPVFGNRIDPTLKPQWSWLLKTLNRRLEGKYGISLFDVDFWIDDYFLRLVYNLLNLDYHFHQVSFASEFSSSYFVEEQFNRHIKVLYDKYNLSLQP